MAIQQISRRNVSNEIFEQIKGNIISGEWKPGDKIPSENELKDLLGVSRNSVRAALQQLTALGLITTRHGEGTFVNDLSPSLCMNSLIPMLILDNDGLVEMLEFRRIIEIESVKLAAQRAQKEDIEELERITRNMFENNYDPEAFAKEDALFHETLTIIARNSILTKVNKIIEEMLISNQVKIQGIIGPSLALKYHPMILDAVKKGDSLEASKAMEEHINVTIQEVKRLTALGKMD